MSSCVYTHQDHFNSHQTWCCQRANRCSEKHKWGGKVEAELGGVCLPGRMVLHKKASGTPGALGYNYTKKSDLNTSNWENLLRKMFPSKKCSSTSQGVVLSTEQDLCLLLCSLRPQQCCGGHWLSKNISCDRSVHHLLFNTQIMEMYVTYT